MDSRTPSLSEAKIQLNTVADCHLFLAVAGNDQSSYLSSKFLDEFWRKTNMNSKLNGKYASAKNYFSENINVNIKFSDDVNISCYI